ncbi:MFS transporter [Actinocrispum sp. NPDC049592]|uniref:MFS transporter n=1 Tax=Actinocrispum sp. NPDC049592 TaxID=3154835 RepID=UPI00342B328A
MTKRSGFLAAFRVVEFRALWGAEALSQLGDQLARVALAVLVYARTNSAALAALTLALSILPSFIGSTLFAGLADRYPRREVMVVCDVIAAALVIVMSIEGMPLGIVCLAMAGVSFVGGPFKSARLALLPEVLSGEAYVAGLAARGITIQIAQLLGFTAGGLVVALINPYVALAIDAGTFLLSALLVRIYVPYRPAPASPSARKLFWASTARGAKIIASIPGLRSLYVLTMLAGLYVGPEGLAPAWSAELGETAKVVGLLMAAPAAGLIVGSWAFTKFAGPELRPRLVGPLAALTGFCLMLCVFQPGLWVALALLVLSGLCSSYQVQVGATFATSAPAESRAQVMGLLNSGVLTAQGLGVVLAGVVAEQIGVANTVALAGGIGLVIALPAAAAWNRATAARETATG